MPLLKNVGNPSFNRDYALGIYKYSSNVFTLYKGMILLIIMIGYKKLCFVSL